MLGIVVERQAAAIGKLDRIEAGHSKVLHRFDRLEKRLASIEKKRSGAAEKWVKDILTGLIPVAATQIAGFFDTLIHVIRILVGH
jgi:hypothetical protein